MDIWRGCLPHPPSA